MECNKSSTCAEEAVPRTDEQALMDYLVHGRPADPEARHRVQQKAKEIREAISRTHGLLDIGVPAIRELRGELPE